MASLVDNKRFNITFFSNYKINSLDKKLSITDGICSNFYAYNPVVVNDNNKINLNINNGYLLLGIGSNISLKGSSVSNFSCNFSGKSFNIESSVISYNNNDELSPDNVKTILLENSFFEGTKTYTLLLVIPENKIIDKKLTYDNSIFYFSIGLNYKYFGQDASLTLSNINV